MPRNDYPSFLAPAAMGERAWSLDCQPRPHDLPRALQPAVLLQAARAVYAAQYSEPALAEALALSEAGTMLAILRHVRSDSAAIAAELGLPHAQYQAALRAARHEQAAGDVTKSLRAYGRFLDELNAAVRRVRPGPVQLRALQAALADRSQPNQLWVKKFLLDGTHVNTAAFMANLQEKLARELPQPRRHFFMRDCAAPAFNVRRMVLAFRERFPN